MIPTINGDLNEECSSHNADKHRITHYAFNFERLRIYRFLPFGSPGQQQCNNRKYGKHFRRNAILSLAHTVEAMSTWLKPGAELKHFTTVFDVKTVRLANYFLSIEEGTQRIQAGFSQISNVAEKYGIKIAQLGGRAADEVLAMGDINALKAASSELYGINIESAIDLSKYTPEEAAGMLGKNISKLNFFQKMARNRHLKRLENLRSQGLHKKDPAKYMLEQDKAIRSIKGLSFMNILSKISFYLTVYEFGTISHYSPEQRDAIQYQQELGWMSNEGPEG